MRRGMSAYGIEGGTSRVEVPTCNTNTNNLASVTFLIWAYIPTYVANRQFMRKDTNPTDAGLKLKNLRTVDSGGTQQLSALASRTGGDASATSASGVIVTGMWKVYGMRWTDGGSMHLFHGTERMPLTEPSYTAQGAGTGTADTDGTALWIGNHPAASPTLGLNAFFGPAIYTDKVLDLVAMREWQFCPDQHIFRNIAKCLWLPDGGPVWWDWSGNGNHGFLAGSAVPSSMSPAIFRPPRRRYVDVGAAVAGDAVPQCWASYRRRRAA